MNAPRVLYQMVRADFLERVRRYSFLLTLAAALYLAYGVAAEKVWVVVGNEYRGVYNSAWIGMLMTVCCTTFLSLVGFYVVKNSLQRDAETRVGRVLAATPMRKEFYTLAKTLSNFSVLACMVLVLMLAALAMQFLRPEARPISLWKLWSPFLLIALPAMFLTASLALLFETLPILRGGVGNILYFFLWTAGLAVGVEAGVDDPTGLQLLYRSTRAALKAADPTTPEKFNFSLTIGGQQAVRTFPWNGIDWTAHVLLVRLLWMAIPAGIALLASGFFHRFDPAKESQKSKCREAPMQGPFVRIQPAISAKASARLAALGSMGGGSFGLTLAELRLMLKGVSFWWYLVALGLWIASLATPLNVSRGILVAVWIWPLLLLSKMGTRESFYQTSAFVFSSARSLQRQFPAAWLAGVIVALVTGSGVALRLLLAADLHGCAAWLAGAFFIPTLALAMGTWSGTSKTFEAVYTFWWYAGPVNHIPGIDFMGTAAGSGRPGLYFLLTAVLLLASFAGRRAKLAYA